MSTNTTLRNTAYSIIIFLGTGYLLHIGASIILPIIFAFLFAIFLNPIDRRIAKLIPSRLISILLSFLTVLTPMFIVFLLFSYQFVDIVKSLPSISLSLEKGANSVVAYLENNIPYIDFNPISFLKQNLVSGLQGPLNVIGSGVVSSSAVLIAIFLTFIYTFLILYYKESIKGFVIFQFDRKVRPEIKATVAKIKQTIQSYIGGLFIVILTLSTINSIGLWLIGINYPIFWGTTAGLLTLIPFIGTALGGILPFLYSLATYDHYWQPIAIVIFYAIIQVIEGNILTPKIVGNQVNINPLIAIISILIFGSFWGVGGIILALPLVSIVRIILEQFDTTKAFALLMSSDLDDSVKKFKNLSRTNV